MRRGAPLRQARRLSLEPALNNETEATMCFYHIFSVQPVHRGFDFSYGVPAAKILSLSMGKSIVPSGFYHKFVWLPPVKVVSDWTRLFNFSLNVSTWTVTSR